MSRWHKYNAKRTTVDGITFDSKVEAARYKELKILAAADEIEDLQLQPAFTLLAPFVNNQGQRIRGIMYKADFLYIEDGKTVVEDVKGMETAVFKIKAKLFQHHYPEIELRIVK